MPVDVQYLKPFFNYNPVILTTLGLDGALEPWGLFPLTLLDIASILLGVHRHETIQRGSGYYVAARPFMLHAPRDSVG